MANVALTYGGYYFSTPALTTLSAATPLKAAGTTTAKPVNGFTHTASNRLTYNGTVTRDFMVTVTFSANTAAGAETCSFHLYKNGSLVTGSTIVRKVSNNDIGAGALSTIVELATNDYVELWVETLGGDNLTIDNGTVIAVVVG